MFIQKCLVSPTCKNTPSGGRRIAATIRQKSTNNLLTELQGWICYRFSLPYALHNAHCASLGWVEVSCLLRTELPRRHTKGNPSSCEGVLCSLPIAQYVLHYTGQG